MNKTTQSTKNLYVTLAETNGDELETWMYFLKVDGNEKALKYLQAQLEKIDMYVLDDLSAFELDLEHPISEQTAKEMTTIEVNSYQFHRKFDGKLQYINIGMKKKDNNERKLERLHDKLGMGRIEEFIDQEDVSDTDSEDDDNNSSEEEDLVPLPSPSPKKGKSPPKKTSPSSVQVDAKSISLGN